jgi:hypothetical protein
VPNPNHITLPHNGQADSKNGPFSPLAQVSRAKRADEPANAKFATDQETNDNDEDADAPKKQNQKQIDVCGLLVSFVIQTKLFQNVLKHLPEFIQNDFLKVAAEQFGNKMPKLAKSDSVKRADEPTDDDSEPVPTDADDGDDDEAFDAPINPSQSHIDVGGLLLPVVARAESFQAVSKNLPKFLPEAFRKLAAESFASKIPEIGSIPRVKRAERLTARQDIAAALREIEGVVDVGGPLLHLIHATQANSSQTIAFGLIDTISPPKKAKTEATGANSEALTKRADSPVDDEATAGPSESIFDVSGILLPFVI